MSEEETRVLQQFACSKESLVLRHKIIKIIIKTVQQASPSQYVKVFEYGSTPLKTFLPGGDIDIAVVTSFSANHDKLFSALSQQFEHLSRHRPDYQICGILEIRAQVQVLKLNILQVPVDISINQLGGLRALCFIERVNRLLPNHFIKRSIIVCKAWASHHARILGSSNGLFSTYALEVLILCVINKYPEVRGGSALRLLEKLIMFCAELNWQRHLVTVCGVVPLYQPHCAAKGTVITPELLKSLMTEYGYSSMRQSFEFRTINILDPFDYTNNLARSISVHSASRISSVFKHFHAVSSAKGAEGLFPTLRTAPYTQVQGVLAPPPPREKRTTAVFDNRIFNTRLCRLISNLQTSNSTVFPL